MTAPTFVDFETRSRADLDAMGGRRYAEHPSTRVICAVLRTPDEAVIEWHPGLPLSTLADFDQLLGDIVNREGAPVCAHNAINFDRHIWRMLGWPEPERWIDTTELAKVAGYPSASLEWLASELLGVEKDMQGNELTLSLSDAPSYYGAAAMDLTEAKAAWRAAHPKGSGQRLPTARLKAARVAELDLRRPEPAPVDPATLKRVIEYCRLDVEIMAELYATFLGQWLDSDLPGLEQADRALNDRGICFDGALARLILDADAALAEQALAEAKAALVEAGQWDSAAEFAAIEVSPARLGVRLQGLGVHLDNAQADTLTAALATAPPPAQALIRARQACSSIAAGKLRAGLLRVSPDGRLRDNRTYMGAHTGRWSGKGMQLDNLAGGD